MPAEKTTLGEKVSIQDDWLEAPTESGWFIIPLDPLAKPPDEGQVGPESESVQR